MEPTTEQEQRCYRHPDRAAGVRCQRCERAICPSCMNTASVGFHCPECARGGRQQVYTKATIHRAPALRPVVTQVLLAVNVAVFVAGIVADAALGLLDQRDYSPLLDGSLRFTAQGALVGPSVGFDDQIFTGVADGGWYRIITSGFLHGGLIHLAFNMFALWRIGQVLEPAVGRGRFVAAYFASMATGSLGVLLVEPRGLTVGASGAIFGLFGMLFLAARSRGIDPWSSGIATTIGINLLITFTIPNISIGGHVGGLVGGLVCGYVLFDLGPRQLRDAGKEVALVAALGAVAAVACVLVA